MRQVSKEQLERRYLQLWRKQKKLTLPSWWTQIAPGRGSKFWNAVEALRKEAGVQRWDTSGMTYIIRRLNGGSHEHQ